MLSAWKQHFSFLTEESGHPKKNTVNMARPRGRRRQMIVFAPLAVQFPVAVKAFQF
jgi:hypothetical protein